jgi:hypothetical protein
MHMAEIWVDGGRSSPGTGGIRASDTEREQVVAILQQHFVDGRITAEELSERVDHLFASRTRGALDEVLRDLPPLGQPAAAAAPARRHRPLRAVVAAALASIILLFMLLMVGAVTAASEGPDIGPGRDGPPPVPAPQFPDAPPAPDGRGGPDGRGPDRDGF